MLSPLDGILGESFDFLRVSARVPGKKGKIPKITGRTNLRSLLTRKGHLELHLNLEPHAINTDCFGAIPPASGSHRDVIGSFERIGPFAHTQMNFKLGGHPDFSRALHKVAFEWLVKLSSWEQVLEPRFNAVRDYVVRGVGHREIIIVMPPAWTYYHEFPNRLWHDEGGSPCVEFILCGLPIVVTLAPDQLGIERMKKEAYRMYGSTGWTYLPMRTE